MTPKTGTGHLELKLEECGELVQAGDAYRRQGAIDKAIGCYDEAIACRTLFPGTFDSYWRTYARAYAGLGVVKLNHGFATNEPPEGTPILLGMQQLYPGTVPNGAIQDLEEAITRHPDGEDFVWGHAYYAEAHRIAARDLYLWLDDAAFALYIKTALEGFGKLLGKRPEFDAWLHAHIGATLFLWWLRSFTMSTLEPGPTGGTGHAFSDTLSTVQAIAGWTDEQMFLGTICGHFDKALAKNANYTWAMEFYSHVLPLVGTPESFHKAHQLLGQAWNTSYPRVHLMRTFAMVCYFAGAPKSPTDGSPLDEEARRMLARARNLSQQVLLSDPEDVMAAWTFANASSLLKNEPYSEAIVRHTGLRILSAISAYLSAYVSLELGIYARSMVSSDQTGGGTEPPDNLVAKILHGALESILRGDTFDVNTSSLFRLDPNWKIELQVGHSPSKRSTNLLYRDALAYVHHELMGDDRGRPYRSNTPDEPQDRSDRATPDNSKEPS